MTPKCKTANSTVLLVERKLLDPPKNGEDVHIAGGDHKGIVINIQPPPSIKLSYKPFTYIILITFYMKICFIINFIVEKTF